MSEEDKWCHYSGMPSPNAYKKTKMKIEEKDWFLSLPEEMKLTLLDDMLKEGKYMMALEASKILLDPPLSEGGISTEKIQEVFDNNLKPKKDYLDEWEERAKKNTEIIEQQQTKTK